MFSTFLALVLAVVPTASAQATPAAQTTDLSGQPLVNVLGTLAAKQQAAEARMRALEGQLKKANDRIADLEAAKTSESTDDSASSTPDPALTEALQAAADARAAYEAATAEYAALRAMLADAQASPAVVHNHVRVNPTPVTVNVTADKVLTWTAYLGAGAVFAAPVENISGPIVGRAFAGLRPSAEIFDSEDFRMAIFAEASYENLGLGVRGGPELLILSEKSGEWGFGGGLTYAGHVLHGMKYDAEYFGGMARGTWSPGSGPLGAMIFLNVEFGGLDVTGYPDVASATRVFSGIAMRFGKSEQTKVTVSQ